MGRGRSAGEDGDLPAPRSDGLGLHDDGAQGRRLTWPPDWRGAAVCIIASGPSAKRADLSPLRGHARVIAIKENVDLCPWSDLVYGCDAAWWQHRKGLPDFAGLKACWEGNGLAGFPDIQRVKIAETGRKKYSQRIEVDDVGTIGAGGNSGFQALNLAVQFGAERVLLIGFDMTDAGGAHWYGRNRWTGANNPDRECFVRWIEAFHAAAPLLKQMGVSVFNGSPHSALTCFPKVTVNEFSEHLRRIRPA